MTLGAAVPLRFPLAFDGKLLGQVLRIFTIADAPCPAALIASGMRATGRAGLVLVRSCVACRLSQYFGVWPKAPPKIQAVLFTPP